MIRRFVFASAFILAIPVACAGSDTGTTTTTAASVEANGAQCARRNAGCESDADCCSLWCASGICSRREP